MSKWPPFFESREGFVQRLEDGEWPAAPSNVVPFPPQFNPRRGHCSACKWMRGDNADCVAPTVQAIMRRPSISTITARVLVNVCGLGASQWVQK